MNYYKLKDDKGNEVKLNVPTSWSDVTYGTYKKIINATDKSDSNIIRILLGLDNVDQLIIADNYSNLLKDIKFVNKQIDLNNYIPPTKVKIRDKEYKIAVDIGKETIGQYNDVKDSLQKNDKVDHVAYACAVYIQPEIDGQYNITKSKELMNDIEELPCNFVIVLGNFFLSKLLGLNNGLMKTYRKASTRPKRYKLGIQSLANYLGL